MTTPLVLHNILAATGGTPRGTLPENNRFARVERDARHVREGDLFIAVRGERFDGHQFVADAAANGASAALVSETWAADQDALPLPLIVVDEPVAAVQRLATAWRDQLGLTVVGITGSVGKTSTKETVAAVLSGSFRTYRSRGNLNTELGLPLCLLETEPDTEVAVLEMGGAYAFGELALLARIAKPQIAVVTNVFPVHIERMGSIEAIAKTKAELVEAVPADGLAVLNGDDARVRAMAERCQGRVLTYGMGAENDVRASNVVTEALEGTSFTLDLDGEQLRVKVPLVGGHAVELALAGITVGHALGMHIAPMLAGLQDPAIQVRLLVVPGPRGSRIIDDTYNASTPSVLSALGLLEGLKPRRAIAVLGEMRELGHVAEEEHRFVGRRAAEVADMVVTYGTLARLIADEARGVDGGPSVVTSFDVDQRAELVDYLHQELKDGDVVLIKGSRGLQMEEMVTALRADAGSATDADAGTPAGPA